MNGCLSHFVCIFWLAAELPVIVRWQRPAGTIAGLAGMNDEDRGKGRRKASTLHIVSVQPKEETTVIEL